MSTWDIGRELENHICEKFKALGINARPSNGSGNKGSNGDISGIKDFTIEAKVRNTKDITIKNDVWDKLCSEIPLHSSRLPVYVLQNKAKKRWAVMNLNDFFDMYEELLKLKESK